MAVHNIYMEDIYRQVSNIRRTKSQRLNDYRTVLRLSLPNPLKPDVKSKMKMQLEQRRQAMLQQHMSDRQFYCLLRCVLYYRFYGSNTSAFIHSIAILTISLDSFYINSHLFISMYHTDLGNPI